jgi:hypothetical protein
MGDFDELRSSTDFDGFEDDDDSSFDAGGFDEEISESSGRRGFSGTERLILAALGLVNVIALVVLIFVITGRI